MAGSRRPTGAAPSGGKAASGGKAVSGDKGGRPRAGRSAAVVRTARLSVSLGTRRAAVLAVVVCALALALAVPLRTYVSQRQEMADTAATQAQLTAEVAQLQTQKDQLDDPAHVEAEARSRLGYVRPGETPYRVQLPDAVAGATDDAAQAPTPVAPWYSELWSTVSGGGG